MIRNEDYEASAPPPSYDTATSMGKMGEMKRGLLRQATKTEDEQEAILEAFSDKAVRRGFIKKVYGILTVQLAVTAGILLFFMYGIVPMECDGSTHTPSWEYDYDIDESSGHQNTVDYSLYERCQNARLDVEKWLIVCVVSSILGLVILIPMMCCTKLRTSCPLNYILLGLFTVCESLSLGVVGLVYTTESIMMAAGLTFAMVLALTIFAFQTKIDFTQCRSAMFVILFLFIICGIMFAFMPYSRQMEIVYAGIGAAIFSIYLIIDTQMMMGGSHKFSISPEEYVFAAIAIYLDIINLFLYLLKIFGSKK